MIVVDSLVKRYGDTTALDGMSFTVHPGRVTGFLGPNGAGKSTTMRLVLGLDRPTSGRATVDGRDYRESPAPMAHVGALLDGKAFDRSRSARNHLRVVGAAIGVGARRVDEVLELAGLTSVASRSAGAFSLGMGQRLGIATALLADPPVVMLDEPVNGLDPDGITWIRRLARTLADEGRTVLISSHLMSEMELTADHLVVVGHGKVLADTSMRDFIAGTSGELVEVSSPRDAELARRLARPGVEVTAVGGGGLEVRGIAAADIGDLAAEHGLPLHQLTTRRVSLEEAFMTLTRDAVEYRGGTKESAA
ncbi:ABC transporter ATP-binding protein [Phycicoccus avicenniae]|uniref:ABC transporter ATP-binding protein n=1 Tax=Phycicoccus avicenniae TaxID=2828860 RepID=UPI003D2B9685